MPLVFTGIYGKYGGKYGIYGKFNGQLSNISISLISGHIMNSYVLTSRAQYIGHEAIQLLNSHLGHLFSIPPRLIV